MVAVSFLVSRNRTCSPAVVRVAAPEALLDSSRFFAFELGLVLHP